MSRAFAIAPLLEAQENEDLARPLLQRLQSLADDRAGPVDLHAAEVNRNRLHRHALAVTRHQQVTDADGSARGVYPHLAPAGVPPLQLVCPPRTEDAPGRARDAPRHARVVSLRR